MDVNENGSWVTCVDGRLIDAFMSGKSQVGSVARKIVVCKEPYQEI